jgi:hypothetical protein
MWSLAGIPTAHVFRVERKRGPVWYAKYRLPDGRQAQKKVGPAWMERGRPASGYFTKRLAEEWLRSTLDEAAAERCQAWSAPVPRCRGAGRARRPVVLADRLGTFGLSAGN